VIEIADDEASVQFGALIDRAILGEVIVITRAGKPVARLQPTEPDIAEIDAALHDIRALSPKYVHRGITMEDIRQWTSEGRP
jgi:prevent-host-death family protein